MTNQGAQSYLLRADLVVTCVSDDPIADGAIRIRGGRIEEVGKKSNVPANADDVVLDFAGSTLLPGLIDCHEHLSGHDRYAIMDASVREPDTMFALVATFHARRLIESGVTTARIPGTPGHIDLLLRRAIQEGYVEGPRLICAGRHLTMTGGHGSTAGVEVDGPHEAAKAARAQFKAGADFIKIMASGGVGITRPGEEPSQPELTEEELSAAVRVAHAADRRITAHADGVVGIGNALSAGVDCIEHGIFLTTEQAHAMAASGVFLVPTLSTMRGIADHGLEYGMPRIWVEIAENILEPHRASFKAALEAGVQFAAGTDGFGDLIEELEIFMTFGLSPQRAIQAATRDAARVIGPSANYGSLQPGYSADVIAVRGNPLESLRHLRDVQFVMLEGKIVVNRDH